MADRSDKFTWSGDELSGSLSQCSNCKNNIGITGCRIFGTKPSAYALNNEDCPVKEKE